MVQSAIQEAAETIRNALANGAEVRALYVSLRKFELIKQEAAEMSVLPRDPVDKIKILGVPVFPYDERALLRG